MASSPLGATMHVVAGHLQRALERAEEDLVVLDDQNADASWQWSPYPTWTGPPARRVG